MTEPADTGDSEILSYDLQYDQGVGDWISIVGATSHYPLTEVFLTDNLVPGGQYQFRIRALNIYGWSSDYSSPYIVLEAAEEPAQMQSVTLEYDSVEPQSIKISWVAPHDNSDEITGYEVRIYSYPGLTQGTFTERDYFTIAECDAEVEPVFSQMYCYVPVTSLRSEPYVLLLGEEINVIARAKNSFGWGDYS